VVKGLGMQEELFLPPSTANDVPREWMHASAVCLVSETKPFLYILIIRERMNL
jgi:SRSO17 transposase